MAIQLHNLPREVFAYILAKTHAPHLRLVCHVWNAAWGGLPPIRASWVLMASTPQLASFYFELAPCMGSRLGVRAAKQGGLECTSRPWNIRALAIILRHARAPHLRLVCRDWNDAWVIASTEAEEAVRYASGALMVSSRKLASFYLNLPVRREIIISAAAANDRCDDLFDMFLIPIKDSRSRMLI
jgi:hypothetical protein